MKATLLLSANSTSRVLPEAQFDTNERGKATPVSTPKAPGALEKRNLLATSPRDKQFEPTAAEPIPQSNRMGGN